MNLYQHPEPSRKFEFKVPQRFTMTLVIMLMIFFFVLGTHLGQCVGAITGAIYFTDFYYFIGFLIKCGNW